MSRAVVPGYDNHMIADHFPPIETARLRLRCVVLEDAEATAAMMTKAVSDWLASWPSPLTLQMAQHRIELAREAASRKEAMPCAIIVRGTETLAGWIALAKNDRDQRRGSLGYWLGVQHHGQGFAREALRALLAVGFNILDLDVIEAGAQPENTGSFAVMRACGMIEIGSRVVHATSRNRDERCIFYAANRAVSDISA